MWTRSRKCIKSVRLIRQLMGKKDKVDDIYLAEYIQVQVYQSSKEISNDQESIQSNPTTRHQNKKIARKNLTKVHETPQGKLNEQLFPKQVGHSATLLIIKTLQIYLFYLFSILNALNMLKYRCCCRFNVTKQKAECVYWGVGGGGGGA